MRQSGLWASAFIGFSHLALFFGETVADSLPPPWYFDLVVIRVHSANVETDLSAPKQCIGIVRGLAIEI
jgi:hypothetical protein